MYALVWYAYVPPLVARSHAGETLHSLWRRRASPIADALVAAALCLAIVSLVSHRPWRLTVPGGLGSGAPEPYPVGAVAYLARHHVEGNVLTPFVAGAFVSWKLAPAVKVSIDSRYEVAYPPGRLEEHLDFYRGAPGWQAMLDRYPTDLVLALRAAAITPLMATQVGWKRVYEDDAYVLFARVASTFPFESHPGPDLLGTLP
jgi:hypothetical protein